LGLVLCIFAVGVRTADWQDGADLTVGMGLKLVANWSMGITMLEDLL
jgi:hypothetical protein